MRRTFLALVISVALSACSESVSLPFSEPAAAVVDGHAISMKAYQARLEVSRHRDPFEGIPEAIPSPAPSRRLEDFTIDQLVREEIVREEAVRRGITIDDRAVQSRMASLRSSAGSQPFNAALARNGFTPDSFASYQRALLTETTLLQKMASDRAGSAAGELKRGDTFATVASRWSDDKGTSGRAGDAGWLRPSELPEPALARAVEALSAGGATDVVRTNRGFTIASVLERRNDQVHLAVILVLAPAPDLYTRDTTPTWFTSFIENRESALRRSGRIEIKVGSRARG